MNKHTKITIVMALYLSFAHSLQCAPFVYVTNVGDSTVSVIDIATNEVIATIAIGTGLSYNGIAASKDNKTIYVTCFDSTIKRIDVKTNTLLTPDINVPSPPTSLAMHPDGTYLYATSSGADTVYRINLATNTIDTSITGFHIPFEIAIAPDGLTAYVSNDTTQNITPINLLNNTLGTPVDVGTPYWISIDSLGRYAYISISSYSNVIQLDLSDPLAPTVVNTIELPCSTYDNTISPDNITLYTSNYSCDSLTPIDITDPLYPMAAYPVATESAPWGAAITADSKYLYIANTQGNSVSVFDLSNPVIPVLKKTIPVGVHPLAIAITNLNSITDAIGIIRNNIFLDKTERILMITWQALTGKDIVSYNIYNENTLAGTVSAQSPLSFCTLLSCCDMGNNFSVAAVNSNGSEDTREPVILQCSHNKKELV